MAEREEPATPGVARGDRRDKVWIEKDEGQLSKVRHTWPAEPPVEEVSVERAPTGSPQVTDSAVVPEEPSAWEAREDEA